MLKEGKGPINFTVFLTLFGEKLNGEWPQMSLDAPQCPLTSPGVGPKPHLTPPPPPGTDPEESILNAFKVFDPASTGTVNKDE